MEGLKVAMIAYNRPFHLCWSLAVGEIDTVGNVSSSHLLRVDDIYLYLIEVCEGMYLEEIDDERDTMMGMFVHHHV